MGRLSQIVCICSLGDTEKYQLAADACFYGRFWFSTAHEGPPPPGVLFPLLFQEGASESMITRLIIQLAPPLRTGSDSAHLFSFALNPGARRCNTP